MTRINKLFLEKKADVLNIYCTAGYPCLESLPGILKALQKNRADMVEIGMPYSDPLADGPVIQQSNMVAIKNGMTIQTLFDQLKDCRSYFDLPLILMGYLNPVIQFGLEKFCLLAKEVGVDGIILPDLPIREFNTEFANYFAKAGLDFIFLITPETSEQRIRDIDSMSKGFIYAVTSSSTTGGHNDLANQLNYFKKLQSMKLKNPVLAGFGIKDHNTFTIASRYTAGAIIGSAYIKALASSTDVEVTTQQFLEGIINA